jgi:hypothetical protein
VRELGFEGQAAEAMRDRLQARRGTGSASPARTVRLDRKPVLS